MERKKEEYFIRNLLNVKSFGNGKVNVSDPFISHAALQSYSSILSPDGVPNNIRGDPFLAEIVAISDDCWDDIAQIQTQREEKEKEAAGAEKEKRQQNSKDQKIKKTLDFEVNKVFKEKVFFLKKKCPVKIPYKSSLTSDEHEAYLRAFVKFKMRQASTAAETAEYEHYLGLQHRVYEEQNNFMDFSYKVSRLELDTYNSVPQVITNFIEDYFQHRLRRAVRYEEYYINEQLVPICPQDQEKRLGNLSFTHLGHVLSLGTVPRFFLPNKCQLNTLVIDESVSWEDSAAQRVAPNTTLHNTPVSCDRNAEYLAQHHKANIVISTSALKVLADNHGPNFDKEWDIPVEVKSYSVEDIDGREIQHRVVYIDKPMPKKMWTPIEKKQLYFKKAALAKFTNVDDGSHGTFYRMTPPAVFEQLETSKVDYGKSPRNLVQYDNPFSDHHDAADVDVFGFDSSFKANVNSSKKRKMGEKGKNESPKSAKVEVNLSNFDDDHNKDDDELNTAGEEEPLIISCQDSEDEDKKQITNSTSGSVDDTNSSQKDTEKPERKENKSTNDSEAKNTEAKKQVTNTSGSVDDSYCSQKDIEKPERKENNSTNNAETTNTETKKQVTTRNTSGSVDDSYCSQRDTAKGKLEENNSTNTNNSDTKNTEAKKNQTGYTEQEDSNIKRDNFLDNLLAMQNSLFKRQPTQNSKNTRVKAGKREAKDSQRRLWPQQLDTDWRDFSDPHVCPENTGKNVHYQLFALGPDHSQTSPLQPLRILVRTNLHGVEFKDKWTSSKTYVAQPKIESQAYFGCEVNTLSEITQQWIQLLVRPNTSLLQIRVCEGSGDIIMAEEKDLATILKDGKQLHIGFSPSQPLATFYSVFSSVLGQPSGRYLLHHDSKTEAFIQLMKAGNPNREGYLQTYNLHKAYTAASVNTKCYAVPPWLAIDTHVLSPFHIKHKKIPGTFPMEITRKLTRAEIKKKKILSKQKKCLDDLEKGGNDLSMA